MTEGQDAPDQGLAAQGDLLARLQRITCDVHLLLTRDHQMIVLLQFRQPVAVGNPLLLAMQLVVRLAAHLHMALVIHLQAQIMEHVLGPVALGTQVDLLGALAVFDAQLVVAATSRAALAAEDAAGLVRRQVEGHRRRAVGQATHHQRHVDITVDEAHQHFHAHPRDRHAAVMLMGPGAGACTWDWLHRQ